MERNENVGRRGLLGRSDHDERLLAETKAAAKHLEQSRTIKTKAHMLNLL